MVGRCIDRAFWGIIGAVLIEIVSQVSRIHSIKASGAKPTPTCANMLLLRAAVSGGSGSIGTKVSLIVSPCLDSAAATSWSRRVVRPAIMLRKGVQCLASQSNMHSMIAM